MRLTNAARQVALLRLLLVVLALAVVVVSVEGRQGELAPEALALARWLVTIVAGLSLLMIIGLRWTKRPWQVTLHLVLDLVWIGILSWCTGGVASPAIPLFFTVVIIHALALPGTAPFVMPALAGLILGVLASLSLAGITPLTQAFLSAYPGVADIHRIIGQLAIQVGGLFLVELLGQLLARRLGEQRLYTRELLDQLGEGVVAIDRTGVVAYANDEALRLLDLGHRDLTGHAVDEALPGQHLLGLRQHLQTGVPGEALRLELPGGRLLVGRVSLLQDRRGRPIGRNLLLADETRVRLLEENARRAEHLAKLGEMAAGIAHEVRNPLASLRGCAQEIATICGRGGDPDTLALSRIMLTEADRLAKLVDEVLAFSRMPRTTYRDVDLVTLVGDLATMTRLRSDLPPGLTLDVDIDDGLPPVHGDNDQLRQALLNLLDNALHAVRERQNPMIHLRVRLPEESHGGDYVEIHVQDNGVGMDQAVRQRLFTPFFSTKAQGTGLGLALVSRIIRDHEGTLDVHSTLGEGSTFTVLLPARSVTRQFRRLAATSGNAPSSPNGGG